MRIITLNLNGIRSAAKKEFFDWMPRQRADIVCVQELKAQAADMAPALHAPDGYHGVFHYAEKRGYSGVGLYSRRAPDRLVEGLGVADIDAEGRYLRADFGNLSVISLYLPSGSSSAVRQAAKFDFMARFHPHLQDLMAGGRDVILCGDWNIAHREIDLKNWRANRKHSGFLPEERSWLDQVFDEIGFVDVFRRLNPAAEQYTWWSNRGQAWAKNVGWRIDYHIATPAIAAAAKTAEIYRAQRFSDHAPLTIDYDVAF
ncbi:MAG TPA: exodeoxyribonuclease III [Betaproteobacteria bacterium]|nr:exodeoxyribonuclease III [Betaproteobacteria bacterium]